jgi:hypothetical protein
MDTSTAQVNLLRALPELQVRYEVFLKGWLGSAEPPGIYNFYGEVLYHGVVVPLLYGYVSEYPERFAFRPQPQDSVFDSELASRFFRALEALAIEGDRDVRNFLSVELAEEFIAHPASWLERVRPFIGPGMLEIVLETAKQLQDTHKTTAFPEFTGTQFSAVSEEAEAGREDMSQLYAEWKARPMTRAMAKSAKTPPVRRCPECRGRKRIPGLVKTTNRGSGMGSTSGPCPTCDGLGLIPDTDRDDEG